MDINGKWYIIKFRGVVTPNELILGKPFLFMFLWPDLSVLWVHRVCTKHLQWSTEFFGNFRNWNRIYEGRYFAERDESYHNNLHWNIGKHMKTWFSDEIRQRQVDLLFCVTQTNPENVSASIHFICIMPCKSISSEANFFHGFANFFHYVF